MVVVVLLAALSVNLAVVDHPHQVVGLVVGVEARLLVEGCQKEVQCPGEAFGRQRAM